MTTFNAATDAWVPVWATTGTLERLSLADVFERADQVRLAAGVLEDHALHRLLLALTYQYAPIPSADEYRARHTGGPRLDLAVLAHTVREHAAEFEVFDPQRPFLQDAALAETDLTEQVVGILDATVARARPLLSDHRTLADTHPVTVPDALLLLLTAHAYAGGGRYTGWSAFFHTGALTSQCTYRPVGTVADALNWAHTPTRHAGHTHLTYTDRGTPVSPDGPADGYLMLTRRALLSRPDTDGRVARVILQPGWRRAENPGASDDQPGRADVVVATDPAKTLVGDPNRPLEALLAAWHRASPTSLSGWMRDAATHGAAVPDILVTGQAMNQSAWKCVSTHLLPASALADADVAGTVADAFAATRTGADRYQGAPADLRQRALADPQNAASVIETVRARHAKAPVERPEPVGHRLWETSKPTPDAPVEGDPFAVTASADLFEAGPAGGLDQLRRLLAPLHHDREQVAQLAARTAVGVPDVDGATDEATRLVVGLYATWLHQHPSSNRDGSATLASLARGMSEAHQSVRAATRRPLASLLGPLRAAVVSLPGPYAPHWAQLHADLSRWDTDPAVRSAWRADLTGFPSASNEVSA